jgi:hypothetical protein
MDEVRNVFKNADKKLLAHNLGELLAQHKLQSDSVSAFNTLLILINILP